MEIGHHSYIHSTSIYKAYFVYSYELGAERIPRDKSLIGVLQTHERALIWSFPPCNQIPEFMTKIPCSK